MKWIPPSGWIWLLAVVVTVVISNVAVCVLLVRMPARYFCHDHGHESSWNDRHAILRWSVLIAKNLTGVVLVLGGLVLAIPGVPGPGLLLVLLGITLVNFPGKRRMERWLVGLPGVLPTINRLRGVFGRPSLVVEPAQTADGEPTGAP